MLFKKIKPTKEDISKRYVCSYTNFSLPSRYDFLLQLLFGSPDLDEGPKQYWNSKNWYFFQDITTSRRIAIYTGKDDSIIDICFEHNEKNYSTELDTKLVESFKAWLQESMKNA